MTFCPPGVGGCASTPKFACIRPNSSNVELFISSWIAFGSICMETLLAGDRSVLKPNVPVSFTRTRPSHFCRVDPFALQLLLAAKAEP